MIYSQLLCVKLKAKKKIAGTIKKVSKMNV